MSLEPSHVARNRKLSEKYRSICVPLAVANAINANFEDVLFACIVTGLIRGGGMQTANDVPLLLRRLGSNCVVEHIRSQHGRLRPTFTQYRENLRLDRRYIVTKNRHATYGCARFGYFDYRGVFPEARARVNVVIVMTLAEALAAREGLARFMEEKRRVMDVERILATCPNNALRPRKRTRRTLRPRGTALYRTKFGVMTMAQYRARLAATSAAA